MSYNTYRLGSREFQAVHVTKLQAGIMTPVTTFQVVVVPKGSSLDLGTPFNPVTLNGEVGFYTDSITLPGFYEVGALISADPEEPFISCGFIRVK